MIENLLIPILNMSFVSSIIIIVVLCIRFLFKNSPKIFSYVLWGVVLFRLLCPISIESSVGIIPKYMEPIPSNITYEAVPRIDSGINSVDNTINSSLPLGREDNSINPMQVWMYVALIVWISVIILNIGYGIKQYLNLRKYLVGRRLLRDNIYLVDCNISPFVFGVVNPKIYIPSDITESEILFVIAHEKVHIKRLDHITRLIGYIALTLHWFNPLVWLAFILSGKDMEMSCDEAVIKEMGINTKVGYSKSLLKLGANKEFTFSAPLAFGKNNIKGRIENILAYKKPLVVTVSFLVVLVFIFILLLGTNGRVLTPESMKEAQNFSVGNIEKIEIITNHGEEKYKLFEESDFQKIVTLIKSSSGKLIENPTNISEAKETFYITKADGNMFIIGNDGLLFIYNDHFKVSSSILNAYSEFEGTSPVPKNFHYGNIKSSDNTKIDEFLKIAKGTPITEVHDKFGEPDSMLSGMYGDIYRVDDKGVIIYYTKTSDGKEEVEEIKLMENYSEKLSPDDVVKSILLQESEKFSNEEVKGEGHIILGVDESDKNNTKIYALTMVGNYGFENGNLVKGSGTGIIPAVFTLREHNEISVEYPQDGSLFKESIERLFPKKYHKRIFEYSNNDYKELEDQERIYAKEYLESINRTAKIGNYGDFEHVLLTDLGVSIEVSNNINYHEYYPYFIGNVERLENGVRMVYEMKYEKDLGQIIFTKYFYDNKKIIEQIIIDSDTGKIIEN